MIRLYAPLGLAAALLVSCQNTTFKQGLPPGEQVDTFSQITLAQVDVLMIIDDSGSMADKQQNVHDNLNSFFHYFLDASVDYHVAVATTDTTPGNAGQLVGNPQVITSATPNPLAAFQANTLVGTSGNALDTELDAARLVLMQNPPGGGFIRSTAYLVIIWISDGTDASYPGDPTYFYRFFASEKGQGNDGMILGGAITGDLPMGCFTAADGQAPPGTRLIQVVQMMNGTVGSICSASFADTLDAMGIQAVGLQRDFKLSLVPDLTTLSVTAKFPCSTASSYLSSVCTESPVSTCSSGGSLACTIKQDMTPPMGIGWEYNATTNEIIFDTTSIPPKGTTFEVIYYETGKAPH